MGPCESSQTEFALSMLILPQITSQPYQWLLFVMCHEVRPRLGIVSS